MAYLFEIEQTLYDRLGYSNNPDNADRRRINNYINRVHREILTKKGFYKLRRRTMPVTSTANTRFMALPQAAVNIFNLTDIDNRRVLREIKSTSEARDRNPIVTDVTNIPYGYLMYGWNSPVFLQPTAAAELFVISDSATDGTGISATVEGVTSDGQYRRASVAMNGTTGVSLDSTITTWWMIQKFFLSAAATGTITLRMTSGAGTILSTISPGRSASKYTVLELIDTPSAAIDYYADVELRIDDMISPRDEPIIHDDFTFVLEAGAMAMEALKRKDGTTFQIENSIKINGIRDYNVWLNRNRSDTGGQNGTTRNSDFASTGGVQW